MEVDPHQQAVLNAEVKRLVNALAPFGVLHRDALEHKARADCWHEPKFDEALRAAITAGKIHKLPMGFYALGPAQSLPDGDAAAGQHVAPATNQ
jgi:hypothetical protein